MMDSAPIFHYLARGILLNNKNQVLLCKEIGVANSFLPGGHVEIGESAKDALIRELLEECGLKCQIKGFVGASENHWVDSKGKHFEICLLFELNLSEPMPTSVTSLESHLEFFWADSGNLGQVCLLPENARELIKNISKGQIFSGAFIRDGF
jgi:ADP-ribose pyrophosphatase YjhB (NUDIX family)